ncbi:MAG: hypothetical protein ACI8Z5_001262, partial [Lentimonas sp.]
RDHRDSSRHLIRRCGVYFKKVVTVILRAPDLLLLSGDEQVLACTDSLPLLMKQGRLTQPGLGDCQAGGGTDASNNWSARDQSFLCNSVAHTSAHTEHFSS